MSASIHFPCLRLRICSWQRTTKAAGTHADNKAWVGDYGHPSDNKSYDAVHNTVRLWWFRSVSMDVCVSLSLWFIHASMIRINQSTMSQTNKKKQTDSGWGGDTAFTTNEDIWFLPLLFKYHKTLSSLLFSPLLLPPPSFSLCLTERRLLEFELSL